MHVSLKGTCGGLAAISMDVRDRGEGYGGVKIEGRPASTAAGRLPSEVAVMVVTSAPDEPTSGTFLASLASRELAPLYPAPATMHVSLKGTCGGLAAISMDVRDRGEGYGGVKIEGRPASTAAGRLPSEVAVMVVTSAPDEPTSGTFLASLASRELAPLYPAPATMHVSLKGTCGGLAAISMDVRDRGEGYGGVKIEGRPASTAAGRLPSEVAVMVVTSAPDEPMSGTFRKYK
ncbi:hypothetical protein QYE76_007124 [Lolium multiflorum]|uniref:Uncharacterized protein n=1 Tax=Lolium multiflorum TaxID=4521 RepID=A0AAD8W3Z9_LOLMU|nr:hypothetical protein QYE76_007124 [Lolium multiflorum]